MKLLYSIQTKDMKVLFFKLENNKYRVTTIHSDGVGEFSLNFNNYMEADNFFDSITNPEPTKDEN